MFPHCSVSLSGLQPFASYVIMMDMVPVDSFKYRVNAFATLSGHSMRFCIKLYYFYFFCVSCFACWLKLGTKTNRLQYAKHISLHWDIGLTTLGHSWLHIKAFHGFLFVHSRLDAQSISIPSHSLIVNEKQTAIHTFNSSHISRPIWSQVQLLAHTWKTKRSKKRERDLWKG